jgi:hypothetical protein
VNTGGGNASSFTVHLVSLSTAAVVATLTIPNNGWNYQLHVTGNHLYYVDSGGVLKMVDAGGTVTSLITLTTPNLLANAAAPAFVVSPDETQVAWGYPISASSSGSSYTSRVYVAPVNGTPRVLLNDTDDTHGWALPFAWAAQSIWVARPGYGLGGAGPFLDYSTIGATSLDPSTGTLGQQLSGCTLSDYRAMNTDGSYACFVMQSGSQHVRVHTASGDSTIAATVAAQNVGALRLAPAEETVVYGTAVTPQDSSQWAYTGMVVLPVSSGSAQTLTNRLIPAAWITDSTLLVEHATTSNLGIDGVETFDLNTSATQQLDGDNLALGVLPSPT